MLLNQDSFLTFSSLIYSLKIFSLTYPPLVLFYKPVNLGGCSATCTIGSKDCISGIVTILVINNLAFVLVSDLSFWEKMNRFITEHLLRKVDCK